MLRIMREKLTSIESNKWVGLLLCVRQRKIWELGYSGVVLSRQLIRMASTKKKKSPVTSHLAVLRLLEHSEASTVCGVELLELHALDLFFRCELDANVL